MGVSGMERRQELAVQASSVGPGLGVLLPRNGHDSDLVRLTELVQRTREMVRYVNDARDGVMLVRRASATDKLVTEALKGCRLLESEQFTLRQAAAEAHLRTQRRAGELLSAMEKNGGGRPPKTGHPRGRLSRSATLAELGITRNESHRWQRLAELTEDQFEDYVADCHSKRRELTTIGALARARTLVKEQSSMHDRPSSREAQLAAYEKIKLALADLIWLDPTAVISAMDPARRPQESEDVCRQLAWLERFRLMLDHRDARSGL